MKNQPPSGGCVLKPKLARRADARYFQPPSGGCVLKLLVAAVLLVAVASRLQAAVC